MQINVRVIARAKFNRVELTDGVYRVHTTTAPTDGKATRAVIAALSDYLKIPKSHIKLVRGTTGRDKVFTAQQ